LSRDSLIVTLGLVLLLGWPSVTRAVDPHIDPSLVPGGCSACHRGHGVSRSPMLPAPQSEMCLQCHDSRAQADRMVDRQLLTANVVPRSLSSALSQPYVHPLSPEAFSRHEPGAVTCTSCHSPHRGAPESRAGNPALSGRRKLASNDPNRFEFELCQSCHGSAGLGTQSLLDISRLTNPNNRSTHPVEAPALESSPSLLVGNADREVNCTDCHGNSDRNGAAGPHGSAIRYILREEYVTADGETETAATYALCYSCHDRERVLDSPLFPLHREHVVEEKASCATCHSAHGSIDNRALVRFGEETFLGGVGPSARTGQLGFVSDVPGAGTCFLTCHGVDHAPESYGGIGEPELFDRGSRGLVTGVEEPRRVGEEPRRIQKPNGERRDRPQ